MNAIPVEREKTIPCKSTTSSPKPVTPEELERDLRRVYHVPPFSAAALDVYEMTRQSKYGAEQIAAAIQRAPWLSAEILARSNSAFYNPSGERITDLSQAVARIGQKRVGELALSSNALLVGSKRALEWMDTDLAWHRSLAAGVALEYLVDQGDHYQIEEGLTLAATMHLSGRSALGALYPEKYHALLEQCHEEGLPLLAAEKRMFPENHAQVLAKLLQRWRIPPQVYGPLALSVESYDRLARLPEPLRTQAELLKTAMIVGALATGRWQPWDLVEFPPAAVLGRLAIRDLQKLVDFTEHDATAIAAFNQRESLGTAHRSGRFRRRSHGRLVRYLNLSAYSYDLVARLLESVPDVQIEPVEIQASSARGVVINCLGQRPDILGRLGRFQADLQQTILCDALRQDDFADCGHLITIPCSYGILSAACLSCSVPPDEQQDACSSAREALCASMERDPSQALR